MTQSTLALRLRHPLFRTTFVRSHIDPQLTAIDEVLAVKFLAGDLERGLGRKPTAAERRLLLDDFFGREESGRWLYLPLALLPHAGDRPILPPDHLTCLTDYLARPPRGAPGVLLAARSGAGKTMAGIKAFRDCVVRPRGADRPPLADRLPVRLRLSSLSAVAETLSDLRRQADPAAARRRAGQVDSPRIVEELLLVAADLTASLESLRHWLRAGPPLLVFLDLNTADNNAVRLAVARSLCRFQEDYVRFGHRCIVTYRSTEAHDDAMTALRESEGALFRTFDLAPVDPTNAVAYLRHLRVFESDVYGHFDLTPPRRDIERECRTLEGFVQRYAANRESLISTPLIMELVAMLRPRKPGDEKSSEFIKSLADLYERVVEDLLDRQGLTSETDREWAIVGMVRLALAIVARGPRATWLEGPRTLFNLLNCPEYGNRGAHRWHPTGEFWVGTKNRLYSYYSNPPDSKEIPTTHYRERALFAAHDESMGFLHDSFVYYFAAYALRYHEGPDRPPADVGIDPDAWPCEAAARILPQLASWEQPLEFLGGMLPAEEVRKLTVPLLTAEPRPEMARVLVRLLRGRRSREQAGDDVVLRQMERAVRSRLMEVQRFPEALFPHVYNHLSWCEEPQAACHAFSDGVLRPAMNATSQPWLRAETPMPPLAEQVLRCDSEVRCLAASGPEEFITGHEDGTVRRWRADTGQCDILYKHEGLVWSVAVDGREGSVLSGGRDGTVRRWQADAGQDKILYWHELDVFSVAVDARGRAVLSGGRDGTVRRLLLDGGSDEILYQHKGGVAGVGVNAVGVNTRDGAVLLGESDGTVRRLLAKGGAEILYRFQYGVQAIAVDGSDGTVLLGGADGIYRLPFSRGKAELDPNGWFGVNAIAVDGRDGTVLWGGNDHTVRRLLPGVGDSEILYRHEGRVNAVAVDGWDGAVLSGGDDKTVRRWVPGSGSPELLYRHEGRVNAGAVDGRSGTVLSGSEDEMIRRWSPEQGTVEVLYDNYGVVNAITVNPRDGAILSGGKNGVVRRWLPRHRKTDVLYRGECGIRSLAAGGRNGEVVWCGDDGAIRIWSLGDGEIIVRLIHHQLRPLCDEEGLPGRGETRILDWQPGNVLSVAMEASDSTLLTGGADGTVRHRLPGQSDGEVQYRHDGQVLSVAVDASMETIPAIAADTLWIWRKIVEFLSPYISAFHKTRHIHLLSGGDDANLRLFRLANRDFLMMPAPYSIRSVACSLRHNRIALALGDGRLVLVRVEPSVEALLQWRAHPSERGKPTSESLRQ